MLGLASWDFGPWLLPMVFQTIALVVINIAAIELGFRWPAYGAFILAMVVPMYQEQKAVHKAVKAKLAEMENESHREETQ